MLTRFFYLAVLGLFLVFPASCHSQAVPQRLETSFAPLNKMLAKTIRADEFAISAPEAKLLNNPLFLDARETAEYQVSHLPGALMIGYDTPNFSILNSVDKQRPLVVYCTVGYRSERMANDLRAKGFKTVYNLYGSIYAWSLAGFPLVDAKNQPTEKIHTYNKKWGTYFPKDEVEVY